MKQVTVIIPVKDEEEGLLFLVDDFRSSELYDDPSIQLSFVIDGRTSDNSRAVARKLSSTIIDQEGTHGKGAAIQQAIEEWKKEPTPFVVFLDADGSYSFDAVIDVISELNKGADAVSGSRFLLPEGRPEGMSRIHNFGNKVLSSISSIRNRRKISDLCTGLWGFNSKAIHGIEIESQGFDLEAELAGKMRRRGFVHKEIAVKWSQRKGGKSKLRSIRDGFIILLRILRT
jgi:dolichol-phosphate mannosyltransferase